MLSAIQSYSRIIAINTDSSEVQTSRRPAKWETRNPKAETRKKPEIRKPKGWRRKWRIALQIQGDRRQKGKVPRTGSEETQMNYRTLTLISDFGFRISAFFRISGFGLRI
jgi:hypothetical protein